MRDHDRAITERGAATARQVWLRGIARFRCLRSSAVPATPASAPFAAALSMHTLWPHLRAAGWGPKCHAAGSLRLPTSRPCLTPCAPHSPLHWCAGCGAAAAAGRLRLDATGGWAGRGPVNQVSAWRAECVACANSGVQRSVQRSMQRKLPRNRNRSGISRALLHAPCPAQVVVCHSAALPRSCLRTFICLHPSQRSRALPCPRRWWCAAMRGARGRRWMSWLLPGRPWLRPTLTSWAACTPPRHWMGRRGATCRTLWQPRRRRSTAAACAWGTTRCGTGRWFGGCGLRGAGRVCLGSAKVDYLGWSGAARMWFDRGDNT